MHLSFQKSKSNWNWSLFKDSLGPFIDNLVPLIDPLGEINRIEDLGYAFIKGYLFLISWFIDYWGLIEFDGL